MYACIKPPFIRDFYIQRNENLEQFRYCRQPFLTYTDKTNRSKNIKHNTSNICRKNTNRRDSPSLFNSHLKQPHLPERVHRPPFHRDIGIDGLPPVISSPGDRGCGPPPPGRRIVAARASTTTRIRNTIDATRGRCLSARSSLAPPQRRRERGGPGVETRNLPEPVGRFGKPDNEHRVVRAPPTTAGAGSSPPHNPKG